MSSRLPAINLATPIDEKNLRQLRIGQKVYISGTLYTARDTVHKIFFELLQHKQPLPIPLSGSVIYYAGPAPAKPGYVIGPISPTTASRCDAYTPLLMAHGLRVMIGKGNRSPAVRQAIKKYRGVYFAATGGAAALIARCVTSAQIVAFKELGTEAVMQLTIKNLPLIVAIDSRGKSLYETGPKKYQTKKRSEK